MELHKWMNLVPDGSVRAIKYSFGVATANTMAVRREDGTWLVVSPAMGMPPELLEELARDGEVSALVAPNGYHHMGQAVWRARFPQAVSYAPSGSLARLGKKAPGIPFLPTEDLAKQLGSGIELLVPGGLKVADLLVRATTPAGDVWFSGDLVSNTVPEDMNAIPRFILGLLGGGGGYRFNKVPALVYLRDRKAWNASVAPRLGDASTQVILPAHGNPITEGAAEKSRALFAE